MFQAFMYFILYEVQIESFSLALLRIRATAAMPAHDIRGRSRNAHRRHNKR